eukprot:6723211-Pyramimonas_sp.AAC.1
MKCKNPQPYFWARRGRVLRPGVKSIGPQFSVLANCLGAWAPHCLVAQGRSRTPWGASRLLA